MNFYTDFQESTFLAPPPPPPPPPPPLSPPQQLAVERVWSVMEIVNFSEPSTRRIETVLSGIDGTQETCKIKLKMPFEADVSITIFYNPKNCKKTAADVTTTTETPAVTRTQPAPFELNQLQLVPPPFMPLNDALTFIQTPSLAVPAGPASQENFSSIDLTSVHEKQSRKREMPMDEESGLEPPKKRVSTRTKLASFLPEPTEDEKRRWTPVSPLIIDWITRCGGKSVTFTKGHSAFSVLHVMKKIASEEISWRDAVKKTIVPGCLRMAKLTETEFNEILTALDLNSVEKDRLKCCHEQSKARFEAKK